MAPSTQDKAQAPTLLITTEPDPQLSNARGNSSQRMLETCATITDAIAFYEGHREPGFSSANILVADRTGASVIIGAKDGKLQVEKENQCRGFGYGGITLKTLLAMYPEATVTNGFSILLNCRQKGQFATTYSNIYDLKSGVIYLYPLPEREDEVKLNLAAKLKKGAHYFDMPQIQKQLPQAPRPLVANMRRFPMDEFKPIPDKELEITAHVRAMIQDTLNGTARPDDYSAEMWKQVLPVLEAIQAEAKRLGDLISLTLVDRSEPEGQRSYRYRLKFQNVAVLEHLVFDGQNKCLSSGPEALEWKSSANAAEAPSDTIAGIGVVLGIDGDNIIVRGIVPDSPAAAQKDIHIGDRIMAVAQDKQPAVQVQSGQLAQAVAQIRGPKGTTVRLTISPAGENDSRVRVISFVRGELKASPR
jgi:PDZ domain